MLQTLNETQAFDVMENAPHLISAIPTFIINDLHPVPNPLFQAAMTLGGVYSIVMTFFSQIFCLEINMYLASKVTGASFVIFKMITTQISYVFISFGYIILNTSFQLPFNVTFGHSGFLVLWCFSFYLCHRLEVLLKFWCRFVLLQPSIYWFCPCLHGCHKFVTNSLTNCPLS